MTTLEVLRGMRELLAEPARWTQKAPARNAAGTPTSAVLDPEACSWCVFGAAFRIAPRHSNAAMKRLKERLNDDRPGAYIGVARWQDEPERTHAEVLALFDRAIEAEAKAQ